MRKFRDYRKQIIMLQALYEKQVEYTLKGGSGENSLVTFGVKI